MEGMALIPHREQSPEWTPDTSRAGRPDQIATRIAQIQTRNSSVRKRGQVFKFHCWPRNPPRTFTSGHGSCWTSIATPNVKFEDLTPKSERAKRCHLLTDHSYAIHCHFDSPLQTHHHRGTIARASRAINQLHTCTARPTRHTTTHYRIDNTHFNATRITQLRRHY